LLTEYFGGKEPNKGINPDEAVAYGAAVQGGILSGEGGEATSDLLLLDVTPLSLGIELEGGVMDVIIRRGTTIPTEKTNTITTSKDNQRVINIPVYEGERSMAEHNHYLGEFDLEGIPPAPRGAASVIVKFEIDANGILKVSAEDKGSGNKGGVTITAEKGRLSEDDINRMVKEAEQFAEEDRKVREKVEARNQLETYLYNLRNTLEDYESNLSPEDKKELQDIVDENIDWMDENLGADTKDYNEKRHEVERIANPIVTKMYAAGGDKDDIEDEL
jgi:heat shock protein 5